MGFFSVMFLPNEKPYIIRYRNTWSSTPPITTTNKPYITVSPSLWKPHISKLDDNACIYFLPHLFIDENTNTGVLLSSLWHMLSLLSPALVVTNASCISDSDASLCCAFFYLPIYTTQFILMNLQQDTVIVLCQVIPHLSEHKVTLSLSRVLVSFFRSFIMNRCFKILPCRYKPGFCPSSDLICDFFLL